MSRPIRSWVCALAFALLMAACPDDDVGDTGAEDSETASGDGDGDGDDVGGEPTCPASAMGEYEVFAEPVITPVLQMEFCQSAEDDFEWAGDDIDWSLTDEKVPLLIYRPAIPNSSEWPEGKFPIVFHHHGQNQEGDQYDHIAQAVVDDGAIFVSVAGEELWLSDKRALIDICMLRWLFTTSDWDGDGDGTAGAAQLDGNVIIMGHSNGGEAAHIVAEWFEQRPWQDDLAAPEHDMRLCGVVGLAPRGAELSYAPFSDDEGPGIDFAGEATVPYLTIEGSLDNDVPGGSLWNSSHSGFDELHTPTDAAKIAVWVYDAEHDSFGGGGKILGGDTRDGLFPDEQRARGEFIVATWTDAFVRRFAFADLSADPVLFGREQPKGLDMPKWWNYHPAYAGEPLVFVGSEPHQSSAEGELGVRVVVDTMCRPSASQGCDATVIADGSGTSSEGHGFVVDNWPKPSLRSDFAPNLAASGGSHGSYYTYVLRADYTASGKADDPIERTISWDLSSYALSDAATFSFRAANVDEKDYPGMGKGCSPNDDDPADEVDFEVIFVSVDGLEVSVNVSDYARLVAPDMFEIHRADVGFDCPVSHFLQTVRIPLDEVLCDTFAPEHLREVRFVFDRTSGPPGRAVLLDTVEFHRDLSAQPICGSLV